VPQAEALDQAMVDAGFTIDRVLLIEVPDSLIIERGVGRRNDPVTGRIYHIKFDPPPEELAATLVHRKDDTEEAIAKRLDYYHEWTEATLRYYEAKGLLRKVDGVGTPDEVTARITAVLGS
jgi:adenylate kinase